MLVHLLSKKMRVFASLKTLAKTLHPKFGTGLACGEVFTSAGD
jgi:hypothetical protein